MEIEDRAKPLPRQFVLLKHLMPALAPRPTHWDLMFDFGQKLLTFEMRELPKIDSTGATQVLAVTRLADHRRDYLDYEGPLTRDSLGAGRGSVQRVAAGLAQCVSCETAANTRYHLTADQLVADVEFCPCAVGEQTQMRVLRWQWQGSCGG